MKRNQSFIKDSVDKAYQFLETIFKEAGHGAIQMSFHTGQTMSFIGIDLLLEEYAFISKSTRQDH